jgi:hypothetical protein
MIGGAHLRKICRRSLSKAVRGAPLWQTGIPTHVAKPIAKALGGEGIALPRNQECEAITCPHSVEACQRAALAVHIPPGNSTAADLCFPGPRQRLLLQKSRLVFSHHFRPYRT